MATSVYKINKGINKPVEFRGLKAQYIAWLGAGLLLLLILFAILYIAGVNPFLCLGLVLVAGTALFYYIYQLSHRYGRYGMMKKLAARMIPDVIKIRSRENFTGLCQKN